MDSEGHSSLVHHGSKRRELAQHAHIHTFSIYSHTYMNEHITKTLCTAPVSVMYQGEQPCQFNQFLCSRGGNCVRQVGRSILLLAFNAQSTVLDISG